MKDINEINNSPCPYENYSHEKHCVSCLLYKAFTESASYIENGMGLANGSILNSIRPLQNVPISKKIINLKPKLREYDYGFQIGSLLSSYLYTLNRDQIIKFCTPEDHIFLFDLNLISGFLYSSYTIKNKLLEISEKIRSSTLIIMYNEIPISNMSSEKLENSLYFNFIKQICYSIKLNNKLMLVVNCPIINYINDNENNIVVK